MSTLTIHKGESDLWTPNTSASVNPVPADQYLPYTTSSGLLVVNASSKEMGGGLVSQDYPLPPGAEYFGLDVAFQISARDLPHLGRQEMDLKVTFAGGLQANFSNQANYSEAGMWQCDPTGNAWLDSGYNPGPPKADVLNTMQFRFWSDGVHWSVLGMSMNGDAPFIPGTAFQAILIIKTTWTAGLHPQLQMEVMGAPWSLPQLYSRVWILASTAPIPWNLG